MGSRFFHNDWISYWTRLPFRGGTVPNVNRFYFGFADSNLLNRATPKLQFAVSELLETNGYTRSQALFSEDGTFSTANKRHDLPLITGDVQATGATLQVQTVFLMANANSKANSPFNAATNVDVNANTITIAAHGLSNGEEIAFTVDPAASLPGGIAASTLYRAINITTNTFQVSSDGLNPIDVTSLGSGTCRLRYVPGHIVMIREFDDPQLIQSGREFFYDLQIAGFNAAYGVGL
jgi:hypothetical protein